VQTSGVRFGARDPASPEEAGDSLKLGAEKTTSDSIAIPIYRAKAAPGCRLEARRIHGSVHFQSNYLTG